MSDQHRHLTGQGRFVADERAGDALAMVILRSPVAHGRITALTAPEGVTMIAAADLAAAGVGPLACRAVIEGENGPMIEPRRPILAEDKVLYVGQPVAAVLAETEAAALDALDAVTLDIEPLPAITMPGEMQGADAPALHDAAPDNRSFAWSNGNAEETARLFAEAAHIVEATITHPRIAISPMEPRGCLASHGPDGFTITTPSQGVVALRRAFAQCIGVSEDRIRVVTRDVGGSFAAKIWPYPEHVLALYAARAMGRPVRWAGTRAEAFTGDAAGRGRIDRARLALDAGGRFLAFAIEATADMGAYLNTAAPGIVTTGAVRPFQQAYDIPGQHYRVTACFTNQVPTDAYRGAGKPESTTTLERLIDMAAARLGLDQVEIRRRNLLRPAALPYRTPMGETIDAGDFPALLDRLLVLADWAGLPARRADAERRGLRHGAAIGFAVHATGGSTAERSEVRALADGTIRVLTGSQDSGQGHAETLARVAARALDMPIERIRVVQGDSALIATGGGTGGSNLLPVTANTVHRAAHAMLDAARDRAAELLEVATADLAYGAGAFRVAGTDRVVGLARIAEAMEEEDGPGCVAALDFDGVHTTWPNACLAVEVALDPETGRAALTRTACVTDLGEVIDPDGALGQVQGGLAQAVGEALMEGMIVDPDGQPLTGSLMDYALPRADDLCALAHDWAPTDSPNSLIGAKGVGELISIGAPGVVMNAVLDAGGASAASIDRPLTAAKLWRVLRGTRAD